MNKGYSVTCIPLANFLKKTQAKISYCGQLKLRDNRAYCPPEKRVSGYVCQHGNGTCQKNATYVIEHNEDCRAGAWYSAIGVCDEHKPVFEVK